GSEILWRWNMSPPRTQCSLWRKRGNWRLEPSAWLRGELEILFTSWAALCLAHNRGSLLIGHRKVAGRYAQPIARSAMKQPESQPIRLFLLIFRNRDQQGLDRHVAFFPSAGGRLAIEYGVVQVPGNMAFAVHDVCEAPVVTIHWLQAAPSVF